MEGLLTVHVLLRNFDTVHPYPFKIKLMILEKNEILQFSHAKVKSDNLEAENKTMTETLSRLRLL